MAALDREAQRLRDETSVANQQLEGFGGQRGQLGLEFESASQRVNALTAQIAEFRRQLEEKRGAEADGKRHLDSLRAEYAGAMGKKGSLEAVITEHGYATESVRKLFTSGAMKDGLAPVGVLADFLEVDDRYEHGGGRLPARGTELHCGEIVGRGGRGPAPAAHGCGWPGHVSRPPGRLAGQVFVPFR